MSFEWKRRQPLDRHKAPPPLLLILSVSAVTLLVTGCSVTEDACNPLGVARFEADGSTYTLITNGYRHFSWDESSEILLFDHDVGTLLWKYDALEAGGLSNAHHAELLDDEMVIADTNNYRVLIVEARNGIYTPDPDFQVVWNSRIDMDGLLIYPNDANFLSNGNILITERDRHRIIEVDRHSGEIEWEFGIAGAPGSDDAHLNGPHNADRLPDGNTVVADSLNHRILEMDPDHALAWKFYPRTLDWPRDADVLDNGNVLITDSSNGRVLEVTREGETLWEYSTNILTTQTLPYEADLLDNGNVLVSLPGIDGGAVLEVDTPTQQIVWQYPLWPY